MKYITITNRAKSPVRFFAISTDRAIELAVKSGHVHKAANAKVTYERDLCEVCFIHEGPAACQIGPRRVWKAGALEQGSGELHYNEQCTAELRTIRNDVQLDYGEITAEGFTPRN